MFKTLLFLIFLNPVLAQSVAEQFAALPPETQQTLSQFVVLLHGQDELNAVLFVAKDIGVITKHVSESLAQSLTIAAKNGASVRVISEAPFEAPGVASKTQSYAAGETVVFVDDFVLVGGLLDGLATPTLHIQQSYLGGEAEGAFEAIWSMP